MPVVLSDVAECHMRMYVQIGLACRGRRWKFEFSNSIG